MNRTLKLALELLTCLLLAAALLYFVPSQSIKSAPEIPAAHKVPQKTEERAKTQPKEATKGHLVSSDKRAWPGFTLMPESGSATVKLVNMSGDIVHKWNFDAARARLLPNCNLLVVHGTKWGWGTEYWSEQRKYVREFDWDGQVVWEYTVPGPAHHDVHRLKNGNTLLQYRSIVPEEFRRTIKDEKKRNARIRTDIIREVTPEGEIEWEWASHEHLDLNSCGAHPCHKTSKSIASGKRTFDWTHNNTVNPLPQNKWFTSGDTRFKPGNLLLMPRSWSQSLLVSKDSGAVVWDYHGDFEGGLSGGHEVHMIPEGFPGAGNILVFDNGRTRQRSAVLEINPTTKEVVWSYENGKSFFSQAAGSVQRFPGGNTLISEDVPGRVFEVTPDKEVVWSYQAPMRTARAHRYAPDHCAKLSELDLF